MTILLSFIVFLQQPIPTRGTMFLRNVKKKVIYKYCDAAKTSKVKYSSEANNVDIQPRDFEKLKKI